MDEFYNKHYIKPDSYNRIIDCWSDGPHPDCDTADAICINEQGGYQFRLFPDGEENPSLYDAEGIPLYKWNRQAVVKRTAEEIAADQSAIPALPCRRLKWSGYGQILTFLQRWEEWRCDEECVE